MRRGRSSFGQAGTGRPVALIVLALLIAGTPAVSGAVFSQRTGSLGNSFAAGTFGLVNSRDGTYVLTTGALRPGQSVSGTLTLSDQGDFPGNFTITKGALTDTPVSPSLSAVLTFTIEDVTGTPTTLRTGPMNTFATLALGRFNAGESRTYRFTVTFPQSGATPALQGASSTMTLNLAGITQ